MHCVMNNIAYLCKRNHRKDFRKCWLKEGRGLHSLRQLPEDEFAYAEHY